MVDATAPAKDLNVVPNHKPSRAKRKLMDLHIEFTGLAAWVYNRQVHDKPIDEVVYFDAPATFTVNKDGISYAIAYGWVWENDQLGRKGVVIGIDGEKPAFMKGIDNLIRILQDLNGYLESMLSTAPVHGQFLEDEQIARLEGACEALAVLIINNQRTRGQEYIEFHEPGFFLAHLPSGDVAFQLGWVFNKAGWLINEAVLLGDTFETVSDMDAEEKLDKLNTVHSELAELAKELGLEIRLE